MRDETYEEASLRFLNDRFPGRQGKHTSREVREFTAAIKRWREKEEGETPERWLLKKYGG